MGRRTDRTEIGGSRSHRRRFGAQVAKVGGPSRDIGGVNPHGKDRALNWLGSGCGCAEA